MVLGVIGMLARLCAAPSGAQAPTLPDPAPFTKLEFQALRWLEGRWRGSHDGEPFFQAYRLVNDSTIETRTYDDSTFRAASDSGVIQLSGGVITNRGAGVTWKATDLSQTSIHFEPVQAHAAFTWHRVSPLQWSAVLRWHDDAGHDQQRVYVMDRVKP